MRLLGIKGYVEAHTGAVRFLASTLMAGLAVVARAVSASVLAGMAAERVATMGKSMSWGIAIFDGLAVFGASWFFLCYRKLKKEAEKQDSIVAARTGIDGLIESALPIDKIISEAEQRGVSGKSPFDRVDGTKLLSDINGFFTDVALFFANHGKIVGYTPKQALEFEGELETSEIVYHKMMLQFDGARSNEFRTAVLKYIVVRKFIQSARDRWLSRIQDEAVAKSSS